MLWALLETPGATGFDLCSALSHALHRPCSPGRLLPVLLRLERAGLVGVDRSGADYRYALTPLGATTAYEKAPGRAQPALLVMADLVGFTRFTEQSGDAAAHEQASRLVRRAKAAAAPAGGSVVKALGDGVLLAAPPQADPVALLRRLAASLAGEDPPWQIHAAAHVGSPIRHRGDVFGRDVNLVARLCGRAAAGEMLVSDPDGDESLEVPGFEQPVPVRRIEL